MWGQIVLSIDITNGQKFKPLVLKFIYSEKAAKMEKNIPTFCGLFRIFELCLTKVGVVFSISNLF